MEGVLVFKRNMCLWFKVVGSVCDVFCVGDSVWFGYNIWQGGVCYGWGHNHCDGQRNFLHVPMSLPSQGSLSSGIGTYVLI